MLYRGISQVMRKEQCELHWSTNVKSVCTWWWIARSDTRSAVPIKYSFVEWSLFVFVVYGTQREELHYSNLKLQQVLEVTRMGV